MGDKLGKMVKIRCVILSIFFLNLSADIEKSFTSIISAENIPLNTDARIYKISASFNDMILKSSTIDRPSKKSLQKFGTISKKDRYAIQVLNEHGKQVLILGLGNPFYIHADHIGYEHSHEFGGNIKQNFEIAVPLNINASNLLLLSQDEFGFKEVAKIKLN
ncbi:hypothetical protein N9458_00580 [Gammaproteobacteria bacterium]|nr:hypothetical protein [Gammaproteobacteria bacterium]